MADRSTQRLVQLFERELRDFDQIEPDGKTGPKRRVSRELESQVVQFAAEVRTSGSTPEQMLVELKKLLSEAAPEVSTPTRSAFVATLTGRAIDAFFGPSSEKKRRS